MSDTDLSTNALTSDALTEAAIAAWQTDAQHRADEAVERQVRRAADRQWLEPDLAGRLYAANEMAAQWFQDQFVGSWAQPYLAGRMDVDLTGDRGVRPGYAPDSWRDLVDHLQRNGVDEQTILETGLGFHTSKGNTVALMRDRLVFPIHDDTGRIAGFVGREAPGADSGARYINTRQTELFHKDELLYSTLPLPRGGQIAVVEGPADAQAITLDTGGAVVGAGCLGTGFTEGQADLLASLDAEVTLVFDGDAEGMKAAGRAFEICTRAGLDPRMVRLPEGQDPASLRETAGAGAVSALLRDSQRAGQVLIIDAVEAGRPEDALRVAAQSHPAYWAPDASIIAAMTGADLQDVRDALAETIGGADPAFPERAAPASAVAVEREPRAAATQLGDNLSAEALAAVAAADAGQASMTDQIRAASRPGAAPTADAAQRPRGYGQPVADYGRGV